MAAFAEYNFRRTFKRGKSIRFVNGGIENTHFAPYKDTIMPALESLMRRKSELWKLRRDVELRANFISAGTLRTVILSHGYRSSAYNDFAVMAEAYLAAGINVLLVQHRAHGESGGKYSTFGLKESEDLLAWADEVELRVGGVIALHGISMGGCCVAMCADRTPDSIRCIVDDCGITGARKIIEYTCRRHKQWLPAMRAWLMDMHSRLFHGYSLDFDTIDHLASSRVPVLFIHGERDVVVPPTMSMLQSRVAGGKLITVKDAKHAASVYVQPTIIDEIIFFVTGAFDAEE